MRLKGFHHLGELEPHWVQDQDLSTEGVRKTCHSEVSIDGGTLNGWFIVENHGKSIYKLMTTGDTPMETTISESFRVCGIAVLPGLVNCPINHFLKGQKKLARDQLCWVTEMLLTHQHLQRIKMHQDDT